MKNIIKYTLFFIIIILLPLESYAFSSDIDSDKVTSILNSLVDLVTSTPAKIIFVLSIISIGYSTLSLGKLNKSRAVAMVIGIGIVFSSGYIAQQMGLGA